ncbi:hypothetical protein AURDEDRAFT_172271 [Auricularia subglabra TFB-10046 SS5]|nr:hypothetical protein AURDEDRAFT_172271 [Auricularia subglabra TFB-10046 SS5]
MATTDDGNALAGHALVKCPQYGTVTAVWDLRVPRSRLIHEPLRRASLPSIPCPATGCNSHGNRRCRVQRCINCCDLVVCPATGHGYTPPATVPRTSRTLVEFVLSVDAYQNLPEQTYICKIPMGDGFRLRELSSVRAAGLQLSCVMLTSVEMYDSLRDGWWPVAQEATVPLRGVQTVLLRGRRRIDFPLPYAIDMAAGLDACRLRSSVQSARQAFELAFPRCTWSEPAYMDAAHAWERAPFAVKQAFVAAGHSPDGLWAQLAAQTRVLPVEIIEVD